MLVCGKTISTFGRLSPQNTVITGSEDCSGIRSIHLAIMASVFWIAWYRMSLGWGLLTFVSGILGALFLNLARVCFLAIGVSNTGNLAYVDQWHDPAGLIGQALLMAGLAVFAGKLPKRPAGQKELSGVPPHMEGGNLLRTPTLAWKYVGMLAAWLLVSEVVIELWFRRNEPSVCSTSLQGALSMPHDQCTKCRVPAVWTLKSLEGVAPWQRQNMSDAVREKYLFSEAESYSAEEASGVTRSVLWLNFAKGKISSFTHNINLPQVCLPSHDFVLVKQFPDLVAQPGRVKFVLRHQLYNQRGRLLHLFFSEMQSSDLRGSGSKRDGTPEARLDLAWQGIRSQTASLLHILIEGDARKMPPPQVLRQSVANSVKELLTLKLEPSRTFRCCGVCGTRIER